MTPHDTRVFIHPQFEPEYQRRPLVLVDVGARGGLKSNWAAAKRHLRIFGFEPDKQEFERLTASAGASGATEYFGVALHNQTGTIRLNVARDRGLSSLFEPNRAFLDSFPDAGRFDIVDRQGNCRRHAGQLARVTLDPRCRFSEGGHAGQRAPDPRGRGGRVGVNGHWRRGRSRIRSDLHGSAALRGRRRVPAAAGISSFRSAALLLEARGRPRPRRAARTGHLGGRAVPEDVAGAARDRLATGAGRPRRQSAAGAVCGVAIRLRRLRARDRA